MSWPEVEEQSEGVRGDGAVLQQVGAGGHLSSQRAPPR